MAMIPPKPDPSQLPPYILICGQHGKEPYRVRPAMDLEKCHAMACKYQQRPEDVSYILIGIPTLASMPTAPGLMPLEIKPLVHFMLRDGVWVDELSAAYAAAKRETR